MVENNNSDGMGQESIDGPQECCPTSSGDSTCCSSGPGSSKMKMVVFIIIVVAAGIVLAHSFMKESPEPGSVCCPASAEQSDCK